MTFDDRWNEIYLPSQMPGSDAYGGLGPLAAFNPLVLGRANPLATLADGARSSSQVPVFSSPSALARAMPVTGFAEAGAAPAWATRATACRLSHPARRLQCRACFLPQLTLPPRPGRRRRHRPRRWTTSPRCQWAPNSSRQARRRSSRASRRFRPRRLTSRRACRCRCFINS